MGPSILSLSTQCDWVDVFDSPRTQTLPTRDHSVFSTSMTKDVAPFCAA